MDTRYPLPLLCTIGSYALGEASHALGTEIKASHAGRMEPSEDQRVKLALVGGDQAYLIRVEA